MTADINQQMANRPVFWKSVSKPTSRPPHLSTGQSGERVNSEGVRPPSGQRSGGASLGEMPTHGLDRMNQLGGGRTSIEYNAKSIARSVQDTLNGTPPSGAFVTSSSTSATGTQFSTSVLITVAATIGTQRHHHVVRWLISQVRT